MRHEMAVMGREGDHKQVWDPNSSDEVAAARSTFDKLKAKGYLAFRVEAGGGKGEQIHAFDPQAGKIIMAPPMAGG